MAKAKRTNNDLKNILNHQFFKLTLLNKNLLAIIYHTVIHFLLLDTYLLLRSNCIHFHLKLKKGELREITQFIIT